MADATAEDAENPEGGSSKKGLIIGLVLALAGAGGGFFVTSSGLLGGASEPEAPKQLASAGIAFVEVDPITVGIGNSADRRFLRFR
ncbi:MAG: flagellar basal body protein FliL, partial [Pseudomonadota bacterium]